jgi:ornithine cyclodeaminase/alanine dehydrogenase-like protein (mu-crystallin family)
MNVRVLSQSDVNLALPMIQAIDDMTTAFVALAADRVIMPERLHIDVAKHQGVALFMPSYIEDLGYFAIKTVSLFDNNHTQNLPRLQGTVSLFDATNGCLCAIIDAAELTAIRTAAVAGLATRYLSRQNAQVMGLIGTGAHAKRQLEAVCAVRDIQKIVVYSRNFENASNFADSMSTFLNREVIPVTSAKAAIERADVVSCVTTSAQPVYSDLYLKPNTHINAIGSYQPHVQEIPTETILRAKIIVDHTMSAMAETGDFIIPRDQGLFDPDTMIYAQLGQLVTGAKAGREASDDITLFKSVGVAVQDLASAVCLYQYAEEHNIGQVIK